MLKGLYTAYTGLLNEQHRMDVMTNNLANASTIGYKKEGTTSQAFDEILTMKVNNTSAKQLGKNMPGVKIGENYTDFSQGSFKITENTYDLALTDEGFFAVEFTNKSGETDTKYTRAGHFTLNKEGYIVTQDGDYLLDTQNRRIQLNTLRDSQIKEDGTVWQEDQQVAQIQVANFENYDYLEKYGETYYYALEGASMTTSSAEIKSGYLEMSNVQIVNEMVDLITITRAYETNQKMMQTYDQSLEIAANQLGKL